MRRLTFQEAGTFVKGQAASLTALLTREHHAMIDQFKEYKQLTQDRLDTTDEYQHKY